MKREITQNGAITKSKSHRVKSGVRTSGQDICLLIGANEQHESGFGSQKTNEH